MANHLGVYFARLPSYIFPFHTFWQKYIGRNGKLNVSISQGSNYNRKNCSVEHTPNFNSVQINSLELVMLQNQIWFKMKEVLSINQHQQEEPLSKRVMGCPLFGNWGQQQKVTRRKVSSLPFPTVCCFHFTFGFYVTARRK